MKRLLFLLVACLVLGWAAPALAQTPSVEVGKAFKVAFDHPGGPLVTGFRLYLCPGTVTDCTTKVGADIPASLLQAGTVTVDVTAVAARGPYTIQASAFNVDVELKSPTLATSAKLGSPAPPGQPRLVIIGTIAADGTRGFDWRIVDADTAERLLASR